MSVSSMDKALVLAKNSNSGQSELRSAAEMKHGTTKRQNWSLGFPIRCETKNRADQPEKMARGLKFGI